jgi:hypothetical protein
MREQGLLDPALAKTVAYVTTLDAKKIDASADRVIAGLRLRIFLSASRIDAGLDAAGSPDHDLLLSEAGTGFSLALGLNDDFSVVAMALPALPPRDHRGSKCCGSSSAPEPALCQGCPGAGKGKRALCG